MSDATEITVSKNGDKFEAMIQCPAFVDQEGDFDTPQDAVAWASDRLADSDPFEPYEVTQ